MNVFTLLSLQFFPKPAKYLDTISWSAIIPNELGFTNFFTTENTPNYMDLLVIFVCILALASALLFAAFWSLVTFGANIEHREGPKQREKDLDNAVRNSQEKSFPQNVLSVKKLYDVDQERKEEQNQRQDGFSERSDKYDGRPQKAMWQNKCTLADDKTTTEELERQYRYGNYYPFIDSQLRYGALEKRLNEETFARQSAQGQAAELRMKANEAKEKLRERESYVKMLETVAEGKDASVTNPPRLNAEESIGSDDTVVGSNPKESIATGDTFVISRMTEEGAGDLAGPGTSNKEQILEANFDPSAATQQWLEDQLEHSSKFQDKHTTKYHEMDRLKAELNMSRYIYMNQNIVHKMELELREEEIKQLKPSKEGLGEANQKYEGDRFAWWQDLKALTAEHQKAVHDWNHQYEESSIDERESRAAHLEDRKCLEDQLSRAVERDTELRRALSEAAIQGEALQDAHSRLQLCFEDQESKLEDRAIKLRNAQDELQALHEAHRLGEAERNENRDRFARDLYDKEFQKMEDELQESKDAWSAVQQRFEKKSIELGFARTQLNEVQSNLQTLEKEHFGCKQRLDDQAAKNQKQIAKLTSQEDGRTYPPLLIENYMQFKAFRAEDTIAYETQRNEREEAAKKSMEGFDARKSQSDGDIEMPDADNLALPTQAFSSSGSEVSPAWGTLDTISTNFARYWVPQCERYLARPPGDFPTRKSEFLRLCEEVSAQYVAKLDEVDTEGHEGLRKWRKQLVQEMQRYLGLLDNAQKR